MGYMNKNYNNLENSYLFETIRKKVSAYQSENNDKEVINMGVGDVKGPLAPIVIQAMHDAVEEMGEEQNFKGYGPTNGYDFLRRAILEDYKKLDIDIQEEEIFINDGIKADIANILNIFSGNSTVLIPDPVYPAYVDVNVMFGNNIVYLNASPENNFLPMPPKEKDIQPDIIYICSPNNPTGAVYNRSQLKEWIEYANKEKAVILFDSAYECFISDNDFPKSIYEIEGAKECAIEFRSFSKTAGFTGVRFGYTIVPETLKTLYENGENVYVNKIWNRDRSAKCNGVSYIVQRAAEAVFTEEGQKQIKRDINYYRKNAEIIMETMKDMGLEYYGGENSPYIWIKCFNDMSSWECFDYILKETSIVVTPGAGFGNNGEGFFRITAFGQQEKVIEAMRRFKKININ